MIDCLVWLIIYCVVIWLVFYIVETALQLIVSVTFPPKFYAILRLLLVLLVLLWFLDCVGLLPAPTLGHWRLH